MNEDYFDELRRIVCSFSGPRYSPYEMEYGVLQGTSATGNYWQSGWNASAHLTATPNARYYRKVKAEYITPFGINRVYYGGLIPEIVRLVRSREGEEELILYASDPVFKNIVPYFEQEDIMERVRHYIR
jgi:hypothetical protein